MVTEVPKTVYHYTDSAGAFGILNSSKIWLTDVAFLNDPEEFKFGRKIYKRALKRILTKDDRKSRAGKRVLSHDDRFRVESMLNGPPIEFAHEREMYAIFSMSELGDDISQWRSYAKKGYCIGFDVGKLNESLAVARDAAFGAVEYVSEGMGVKPYRRLINARLEDVAIAASDYGNYQLDPCGDTSWLKKKALFLKSDHHRSEREWRLVVGGRQGSFWAPSEQYGVVRKAEVELEPGTIVSLRLSPELSRGFQVDAWRYWSDINFQCVEFESDVDDGPHYNEHFIRILSSGISLR